MKRLGNLRRKTDHAPSLELRIRSAAAGRAGSFAPFSLAASPDQELRAVGLDLYTLKFVAGKIYFFQHVQTLSADMAKSGQRYHPHPTS